MKKLLVLMLVLGMASLANATIVDVVKAGLGSLGHTGESTDPLRGDLGETIEIKLVLNSNPYPGTAYPSYDGYLLSTMDFSLDVSGPGTLDAGTKDKDGNPVWKYDTRLSPFAVVDPTGATNPPYDEIADGLDRIMGVALTPVAPPLTGSTGPIPLVWDLIITCTGDGNLTLDLSIDGVSEYSPYSKMDGISPYPVDPGWVLMVNGDLGDLVIHQVPEPATIALLGLGGLCLLRRRR